MKLIFIIISFSIIVSFIAIPRRNVISFSKLHLKPPFCNIDNLVDTIESKLLPEKFGHSKFRNGQREVITKVLQRKSCLAILATGAGKSLCFQLPAQIFDGMTLVVSPLISLMRDQVQSLRLKGIKAYQLVSSLTFEETRSTYKEILDGHVQILYVSPERFNNG